MEVYRMQRFKPVQRIKTPAISRSRGEKHVGKKKQSLKEKKESTQWQTHPRRESQG